MNLVGAIQYVVQQSMKSAQLADYRVGTVTAVSPLEISVNAQMAPLQESVLMLTEPVIEKKIPVLSHSHEIDGLGHSHSVTGLGHQHNTGGLSHTHATTGLGHSHTLENGATGSALGGSYTSGSALPGNYSSDQQLTGTYSTTSALGDVESAGALGNVVCYENGQPLPVKDGYIILNRGLEVGDKVLLLMVSRGQKFIVLSRLFEGGS